MATNSWLIEYVCKDPHGSTEWEEHIVGEQYRREKRSKREDLELHMRCSKTLFYLPLSYKKTQFCGRNFHPRGEPC